MSKTVAHLPALTVGAAFWLCIACQGQAPASRLPTAPPLATTAELEPEDSLVAPSPPDPKLAPTRVSLANAPAAERGTQHAVNSGLVGVVIGMRERKSECERVIELRVLDEVYLSGSRPRVNSEVLEHETRALLLLPSEWKARKGSKCKRSLSTRFDLRSVSAGDRVALSLSDSPFPSDPGGLQTYPWLRMPRVHAIAGVHQLPQLMRTLPLPRHGSDGEQEDLMTWLPVPGTPESLRQLGTRPRFEVVGDAIEDHAQGITWQRKPIAARLHVEEAGFACQAARTGGHDDWRLPTARELQTTFVDPSARPTAGPRWLEPGLFGSERGSIWWTRTDDDGFFVGVADSGEVVSTHYDSPDPWGPYHVRCVRDSSDRRALPTGQFRKDINTLHDPISGLMWQLPAKPRQRTQEAARRRCEDGSFGGHDDWRLPSHVEALSLMSRCPVALFDWSEDNDVRKVWLDGRSADGKYRLAASLCAYAPSPVGVFDAEDVKAHSLCVRTELGERAASSIDCPAGTTLRRSAERIECLKGEQREGPFVAFYQSGAVFEISQFHAGKRDGRFALYHEQGPLWLSGTYDAGRLDGELIGRQPSGERRTTQRFTAGVPSGTWHFYGPGQREVEWVEMKHGVPTRGQLSELDEGGDTSQVPTQRGLPHGIEEYRAADADYVRRSVVVLGLPEGEYEVQEDGDVTQRGTKHEGLDHGLWIHILPEGEERAMYTRGALDGPFVTLDGLGEVVRRREYRRGKPWGRWVLKDDAGQLVQRCQLDEQGNGTFTQYDNDGKKLREEPYRGGLLHGTLQRFRNDGQLESEEEYRAGKREGRSVEYSDRGAVVQLDHYRDGQLEGPAERHYHTGELRERGQYARGKRTGKWLFVLPSGAKFEVTFQAGEPTGGAWD